MIYLVANTGGIFLSVLRRIVTPRASRPTGATRGRFRARGVKHSYCTGATQLGDVPRSLPIGGGTSALSAALSAIKFVRRRRRGCNTYASLRSEETFMTTHNRNHGPRACREHAKRIALIMEQKLATSAAHASHTRIREPRDDGRTAGYALRACDGPRLAFSRRHTYPAQEQSSCRRLKLPSSPSRSRPRAPPRPPRRRTRLGCVEINER